MRTSALHARKHTAGAFHPLLVQLCYLAHDETLSLPLKVLRCIYKNFQHCARMKVVAPLSGVWNLTLKNKSMNKKKYQQKLQTIGPDRILIHCNTNFAATSATDSP